MSNSLDLDHLDPDILSGPIYVKRLSADDTSEQRVKVGVVFGKVTTCFLLFLLVFIDSFDENS